MGVLSAVKKARERLKRADNAKTAEEKARERVLKVTTKIQLDEARAKLRAATTRRQTEELRAQLALERARTEVSRAKTARVQAGAEKWEARYGRFQAATAPIARILWGKPKSATKRRKVAKRKAATKRAPTYVYEG